MRTKSKSLFEFSSQCDYDVFVIVETWLNADFLDNEFFDPKMYNVYRKDRNHLKTGFAKGGGVLIAVKKDLKSYICSTLIIDDVLDQLIVIIPATDGMLCFCASYIPPNSSSALYASHVNNLMFLYENMVLNTRFIVFGDFNLSNIVWVTSVNDVLIPSNVNHDNEINLIDTFLDMNLSQVNNVYNKLNKILDLIFVQPDFKYMVYECLQPFSPVTVHHTALILEFEFYNFIKYSNNSPRNQYDFNYCNFDALNSMLFNTNWDFIFINNSVNEAYELFLKTFLNICDQNIPLKRTQSSSHPWYTKGLRKIKNQRNKLHKRYAVSGCLEVKNEFLQRQKEFNFLNKFLYKQYLMKIECDLKENPRSFWTFIRSKKQNTDIPSLMKYNNYSSDNPTDIVNFFAAFFESNFKNNSSQNSQMYLESNTGDAILGHMILNEDDVLKAISQTRNSFRADADGLCAFLIKKCTSSILAPILKIFNLSLMEGIFADRWKFTIISPIFKSGRKENVTSYRSISKLTIISKIFEHAVNNRLYFATKSIIIPQQHGFRNGRSTVSNLTVFTDYCLSQLEAGFQIDTIYTDFSKAFDKISHHILLKKLWNLGIHSSFHKWLASYLDNRICVVEISSHKSSPYKQISGVPQGSVLGPLLFNLFVNDIFQCFKNSRFLLYADDLKIFLKIKCLNDARKLQDDINNLHDWSSKNYLKFNINKCAHVSYSRARNPLQIKYKIGSDVIDTVSEFEDLGIIFDSNFTFKPHVDRLIAKAYSMLAFIKRNCNDFSDPYTLKLLYTSFVRSKLEYGALIWNPFSNIHIARIERIQRRFIYFALPHINLINPLLPYISRCQHLGLDSLEKRRKVQTMLFIYDLINGNIDCPALLEKISFKIPHISLRHNEIFHVSCHRNNYVLNNPLIRSLKDYNSLNNKHMVEFNASKPFFKNFLIQYL